MFPLHLLHRLAVDRGDGLHPRLLALMQRTDAMTGAVDLARHRGDLHIQAGPHPAGTPNGSAGNVVAFDKRQTLPAIGTETEHREFACTSP